MVVDALKASFRRAISAENLAEDFGHASQTGCEFMQQLADALADALSATDNRKIKMLFEEWATLYGQAANLSIQQRKKINGSLGFDFPGPANIDLPAKLFVTHTFHSLLMKLISAEIVAAHGMASSTSLFQFRDSGQATGGFQTDRSHDHPRRVLAWGDRTTNHPGGAIGGCPGAGSHAA